MSKRMYGLSQAEVDTISEVLNAADVQKAVIFGSRAKGNYKKGSDVVNLYKITNKNLIEHIERIGKVLKD